MTSKQRNSTSIWFKIAVFIPCFLICFSVTLASDIKIEFLNSGGVDFKVVAEKRINVRAVVSSTMQDCGVNASNSRGEGRNKFSGSQIEPMQAENVNGTEDSNQRSNNNDKVGNADSVNNIYEVVHGFLIGILV